MTPTSGGRPLESAHGRRYRTVGFSLFSHLDQETMPDNSMANAENWGGVPVPGYAIDDQTATRVTDGAVEVVSKGHRKLFAP